MNLNLVGTSICLTFICLCFGCGSEYPDVSGKVTYEGQPLAGIRLVFNPVGDTGAPGPFSAGVTDEAGAFSLETRDGKSGAVAGLHKVGFDWSDIRSYTMRDLTTSLREAGDDPNKTAKIKARIAEVKQTLASRPTLNANLQTSFTVPKNGTEEANFEITEL